MGLKRIRRHLYISVSRLCASTVCWVSVFLYLIAVGNTTNALGIGELHHKTSLGELLDARIALVGTKGISPSNIIVRQLSENEAGALGIDLIRSPYSFNFKLLITDDMVTAVNVSSRQKILEPFVNIVVEVQSPTGAVFREYSLLFDAPSTSYAQINTELQSGSNQQNERAASYSSRLNPERYRVRSGDTLSGIVSRLNLPNNLSVNEATDAILRNNPKAFSNNNAHSLMAGAFLILPSAIPEIESLENKTEPKNTQLKAAAIEPDQITVEPQTLSSTRGTGRLSLSETSESTPLNNDYSPPQIRQKIDSTQEMIDLLVKENQDLRERIENIESSEYLNTLTQLVAMQRQQIEEIRDEFRAQSRSLDKTSEAAITVPTVSTEIHPTLSQVLATNFWLFIVIVFVAMFLMLILAIIVWQKFNSANNTSTVAHSKNIVDDIDKDFLLPANSVVHKAPVTQIRSENNRKPSKNLSYRIQGMSQDDKSKRDGEVHESIRQKTEEYNASPGSGQVAAQINHIEIDVLVGLDEEINELLSMAKIYCSAGKFSEARAILTAQQSMESDSRLVDALEQIDEMEQNKKG